MVEKFNSSAVITSESVDQDLTCSYIEQLGVLQVIFAFRRWAVQIWSLLFFFG